MMITIKDYVEGLFGDIPDSTEKENIKQEIILNLEEKVQDLTEAGKAEEDAINKAIVDFGDIDEIKKGFDERIGPKCRLAGAAQEKDELRQQPLVFHMGKRRSLLDWSFL